MKLESVNQRLAAKVIGKPASFLRDNNPPRNEEGSYCIPDLVRWFVEREVGQVAPDPLKEEKLKEEINVLRERNRKLQFENEETAGNMADVRGQREMLAGLAIPLRKFGELAGRKPSMTGPDVQQMVNRTIEDYLRLLDEGFGEQQSDG